MKQIAILIAVILLGSCGVDEEGSVLSGLASPFPSTVSGIEIPNTHEIGEGVYRGMAPRNDGDYEDLVKFGIGKVVIFKDQRRGEVDKELVKLEEAGYEKSDITNIPFKWKELESFEEPCGQVIEALEVLLKSEEYVFFHCTVGEDRTGLLSGIYKMITEGAGHKEVFKSEMCENGYGAGNPRKPYQPVVKPIREGLTPLFAKMAWLVSSGKLSADKLDKKVCKSDPEKDAGFRGDDDYVHSNFRCKASSKYPE